MNAITAQDVVNSLFNPEEKVCLRVFEDRKEGLFPGTKMDIPCGRFSEVEDALHAHNAMNRGIFYTVNYGGQKDEEITRINAQFVEMDDASFEDQEVRINKFPLRPSMIIKTRKSYHTYWFIKEGEVSRFREVQKALVQWFGGDPMCVNESRVMRLPGFYHCKKEPVMVECVYFHPEKRYTQQQILDAMPEIAEKKPVEKKAGSEKGLNVLTHECDFIRHCQDDAKTLSEHDWYAMITNLAPFEGGTDLIHQFSKDYPGYSQEETQKKINHFLEGGTKPMTCQTIAEKGYKCPKLESGVCGCKSPAGLCYRPMSIEGLKAVLDGLSLSTDPMQRLKGLLAFVREYMYNQEKAIAEGFISYEIKPRFSLKADMVKSLVSEYRNYHKAFQNGLGTRKQKMEVEIPAWYEPSERGGLRFMPGVLAEHLAIEQKVFFSAGQHYAYADGVYGDMSEMQAQKIARDDMIPRETKMAQITDAEKQWRLLVQKSVNELNPNPYVINLKNGLYNVLEDTLTPHTPEYLSTVQLPVSFSPGADCPRFKQYLKEVLHEDQIPLVQEMLGYFLVPVTRAQKCFVIVGEGGAGKSQLLMVLNELLLSKKNVSNVSWQALNERFKTAELFGKLANIFADLPTKNIDDNGIFKALVGEDYLTVEKKNKDPFSFQSKARLLFSCNNIPTNYGDKSNAFYRRLIIIRFDHAVPEDKKDPELMDKFRKEADGIFLFALEGLRRLMRNKYKFSETQANRDELEKYRTDSDSVLSFVRDCCALGDPGDEVGSTELYIAYKNYCEECGMKPYAQNKFVMQLTDAHGEVKREKDKTGNRRILVGIHLSEAE